MAKRIILLLVLLFMASFISASFSYNDGSNFGYNDIEGERIIVGGNYTVNVNNTDYFQGYTPTSFKDWLSSNYLIPYSGANKNVVLGANNFSVDTSVLFVNSNNDRVGIGTTSPTSKLHVAGSFWADAFQTDETTNHTVFVGDDAGGGSSGTYSNFFGEHAGQYNTGASSNAFGYLALSSNTGTYSNAFGHNALRSNTGVASNAFGQAALQSNTGASSNAFGYAALSYNIGAYSNAFGYAALYYNTGASSNAFGYNALQYNDGQYNTAFGDNAFNSFTLDTGNAKTFDYTDIDVSTNQITIPTHGFGAINTYRNLKYTQGTSAITGMTNNTIYQFKVIDANTLKVITANPTNAGTGTGHTLTPQFVYTNSLALGYDAEPTASNQVVLGNNAITTTILKGNVGIGTTTPAYKLTVGNGSATNSSLMSIYAEGNISSAGFITRTSVYDKDKGYAYDYVKNADEYYTDGEINHTKFYGYTEWKEKYLDYSKPIVTKREEEICDTDIETGTESCENIIVEEITYSEKERTRSGVDIGKEIDVLRQALRDIINMVLNHNNRIYQLELENNMLKEELCRENKTYSWCLINDK